MTNNFTVQKKIMFFFKRIFSCIFINQIFIRQQNAYRMRITKSKLKVSFSSILIFSLLLFSQLNANTNSHENGAADRLNTACEADFIHSEYDGSMPVLGGVVFENISEGAYTETTWDFGDGNDYYTIAENTVTHFYSQSGIYQVNLSVWNATAQDCFSTITKTIEVWIPDDPCEILDCVWPGDTNADGVSNMEDVLNIGLEFGAVGPARDSICGGWYGHLAEDWDDNTVEGVNLKHGDCNGDGIIDLSDLPYTSNIDESYTQLEGGIGYADSDGPDIKLQFNVDTVHLTNALDATPISAALMLGSSSVPMEDVYGVVLYMEFTGEYLDSNSQINVDYDENSFFGGYGEVIPRAVDLTDQGQLDFAITRKNGENASGYGRIASVNFIIDADIIDGRAEDEGQSFDVALNVLKVINKDGDELDINLSAEPASVFFVNNIVTSVVDPALSEKVKVYPNPVSDDLNIDLGDLEGQTLELYDVLGKQVSYRELQSEKLIDLKVDQFEEGIYMLKIQTDQGIVSKRVVVK